MNTSRYRFRLFLLRATDWILLFAVAAYGYYAVLYAEHRELAITATLCGLFLVDRFGDFTREWAARVSVDMEIEEKRRPAAKH